MRWFISFLVALLLVEPLYELRFVGAQSFNLRKFLEQHNLINYTEPEIVELQLSGVYVSGGGLYLRNKTVEQPPLMVFKRPRLEVGCGSIDAFFGSFGFINFDWLVTRLQQLLNAAPYVAFKIGLSVLLPQVDAVLATAEAVINQLNSLQIDQCGRITGIDVNFLRDPAGWVKKHYSEEMASRGAGAAGTLSLKHLRDALKGIKSGDLAGAMTGWNQFIDSVFSGMASSGVDINTNKSMPSLVNAVEKKIKEKRVYSPYMDYSRCLYKKYVGDVAVNLMQFFEEAGGGSNNNSGGDNANSGGVNVKVLPVPNFTEGSPGDVSNLYKKFEVYMKSGMDEEIGIEVLDNQNASGGKKLDAKGLSDCKVNEGGRSRPLKVSDFKPLPDLVSGSLKSYIQQIYQAMRYKQKLSGNDKKDMVETAKVLASIPGFPALTYIQWAAIADSNGASNFFGRMAINDSAEVLSVYSMCRIMIGSLTALHQGVVQNLNELYLRTCSGTIPVFGEDGVEKSRVPASAYCEEVDYRGKVDTIIAQLNSNFNVFISALEKECDESIKKAEEKIESIRGVAAEAERIARSRLSRYGMYMYMADVSVWKEDK